MSAHYVKSTASDIVNVPFSHETCRQTFSQSSNLQTRNMRHTNDRPYGCVLCSEQFASVSSLRVHKNTHNGIKELKRNLDHCNERFRYPGDLKNHQNKRHTNSVRNLMVNNTNYDGGKGHEKGGYKYEEGQTHAFADRMCVEDWDLTLSTATKHITPLQETLLAGTEWDWPS
ncbi:hypothetical protein GMDG_01724 [Pseudogymnoascus destructans 20631-21]|uniref:C2H2-type domain-containing protein n=1 Tax=Pseudogymnoascus destructans (strain ATCC MYA-4855 / 20631-21) TaxID=658429 RepID=L8FXY8_PSED2|nr:hypothetical protein GMDG_01724 [Pseudogymnoascus destructans 20631-21]